MAANWMTVNWVSAFLLPLLVAFVTALATAWLAARRAHDDRLAALRLDAYRNLVVSAKGWQRGIRRSNAAGAAGEDVDSASFWEHHADKLLEQMDVLPFVADSNSLRKIEASYHEMIDAVMRIDLSLPLDDQSEEMSRAPQAFDAFVDTVMEEANKEVRRRR